MSKKKKKQRDREIQAIEREIPIQDDPYWKVSGIYMDAHRVGRSISRFERFEDRHSGWVDHLMDGMPTYYCILGVGRGATEEEIEKAYEKKLEFSGYADETVEEAFEVLSNPVLQKEYDELLFIFEQITKCMLSHEKNELIKMHSAHISIEKEYVRMGQLMSKYRDYNVLYMSGMPDLYEIAGLSKDSTFEDIKKYCETGSELLKKICAMLGDPAFREDYNFLIYFITKYTGKEHLEKREKRRKKWEQIDKSIFEKMILTVLNEPDAIGNYMQRRDDILNSNQDWEQYLSPNKTFLSMLGLEEISLSGDKKEIEKTVREKYRILEKTAQINLAYTVLKNASQREDYLWLLENHEMLNTLANLFSEEENVTKGIKRGKNYTQTTFDDIKEPKVLNNGMQN